MLTFTNTLIEPAPGIGLEAAAPLYDLYFRRYGVMRAVQLAVPRLNKLDTLVLPRNAVLHYLPEDETELGISQTHPLMKDAQRIIMVEHVTELTATEGNPRRLALSPTTMKMQYHRQNRRTRDMLRPDAVMRDPMLTVVEDYCILSQMYRYPINFFRSYYRWSNIQNTLWTKVGQISRSYGTRHQFLECRLPRLLPTLQLLRRAEQGMTRMLLPQFIQPESLMILQIWQWLGHNRANSILNKATPEELSKMNLIFQEQDRWLVLNLGLLDQWRKRPENEPQSADHKGILEPIMVQKRFLRLLMSLMEVRTGLIDDQAAPPADGVEETQELVDAPKSVTQEPTVATVVKSDPVKLVIPNEDGSTSKIKLTASLNLDKLPDELVEETPENIKAIDDAISKDLEALDHLVAQHQEQQQDGQEDSPVDIATGEVSAMIKYTPEARTLEGGVMAQVDQMADAGLISGAEYRRMSALATSYQRLPNPFGQGTLDTMLTVTKEETTLPEKKIMPDTGLVPDKTMLKSSINHFDEQYLSKVFRKDISRMVLGVQNAGVAVTSFEMTEQQDALNHYEKFSIQLTPAVGKQSTVHFKLPKVQPDGTYRDNGSRYRMRIQRGDMPIRKLSPEKVALTSYYNKVFVTRSERQVYNYPGWLTNQIATMAIQDTSGKLSNTMFADVFDSEVRTPRVYSILARRFRSFHIQNERAPLEFFFDYHAREAQYGNVAVSAVEKDGLVVVGKQGESLLAMDNTNAVYRMEGGDATPIGSMESLLELKGKPVAEMAEIRIFGKQIPVGFFLAYHLGMKELFRLLGVTPRRVPTGQRANVGDDEMALRFEDETWVFPMDRSQRTLILAGLVSMEKYIQDYSSHLFDRKDVYYNVLDKAHIGVRYLREMDLLKDMFVDPITEEILKEMGEPTEFIGLVMRACELLQTDWSPLETDMAYMRLKGYERMAGAVYAELVKAVRNHRARGSMANQKIDMHPDAVWIGISMDSVKKAVEEANPVHNVREREEVTFSGVGGRSNRSMVGRTRVYNPNDMGVISESTKDSGDVAITTFTAADPTLVDVRGITRRFDPTKDGMTSIFSSPALLSPGADRDD